MEFQKFDEIISLFKKPYKLNIYSKLNYKITSKILDKINNERDYLLELLNEENEFWSRNYKIDKFLSTVNALNNIKQMDNKKFGIGNVIAIETGDPCLHLETIIKAIIANCKIMVIANPTLCNFNMYITSIVRDVLKEEKLDENLVSFVKINDYKQKIKENEKVIDCIVVNKEYGDYDYFVKNSFVKVIYLDFGNVNVYTDSDEYEKIIDSIVEKCDALSIDVYDYKFENLQEFFSSERNNFTYNTAVIFSKDIKKCMDFYEAIKARNVFINTFDINKIKSGLDINDFLLDKKIIIEDGK